ncbi:MAG: tetratricopeptide repeat protein [Saccharothrix sp.]|nr:tetratricopeptide repeat protein [Saccharothrix sp.]
MEGVRNEVSGAVVGGVVQAHTVVVSTPTRPAAVAGLPAQPVFVGREREVDRLSAALGDSSPVVVWALGGLPGVGKTALAVRAAHLAVAAGRFPGGTLMVNLRGYDPPGERVSASSALASLLGALGVAGAHVPDEIDDRARLWRTLLATRAPTLLIADNASSAGQVHPLLPGAAGAHRVLVTSRGRLTDLDGARTLDIDVLPRAEAVRMLADTVSAGNPDDRRAAAEPDGLDRIAALCGGLPLALRVTAALLTADPDRTPTETADTLVDDHRRLEVLRYNGNLAVRAAFDLSYRNLGPEYARLFRLIGVHPTGDLGTEAVAALTGVDMGSAKELLRGLARAHLLHRSPTPDHWVVHDLLRAYSAELARTDPERRKAVRRLIDHFADAAEALDRTIVTASAQDSASLRAALEWADSERPILVAVVEQAASTGDHHSVLRLAFALEDYLVLRRVDDEIRTVNALGRAAARALDDRAAEARLLSTLGRVHRRVGRFEEATTCLREALVLYQAVGERTGEGKVLNYLSEVHRESGRLAESIASAQQALLIFRESGSPLLQGTALHNIAVALRLQGRALEALDHHLQDQEIRLQVGDPIVLARGADHLGITHRVLGRFRRAVEYHEEGIALARELGSHHDEARALTNLGVTYRAWGRLRESVECLERAARRLGELSNLHDQATALEELGSAWRAIGDREQARRAWGEALAVLERLPGQGPRIAAARVRGRVVSAPA